MSWTRIGLAVALGLGAVVAACSGDDESAPVGAGAAAGTAGTGIGGSGAGAGGGTAGVGGGAGGGGSGTGGQSGGAGGGSAGIGGFGGALPDCTIDVTTSAQLDDLGANAQPGDVICVAAGEYDPFKITASGTDGNPIVFRAKPGDELQARVTRNDFGTAQGIKLEAAHWVTIDGLWVDQVNQGIFVLDSDHVVVQNCKVTAIGQECLRFKFSDFGAFIGNDVEDCGKRHQEGMNGEGIYVGSGDEPGDDTHDALIRGNHVRNATDEGVELKGSTSNCIVEGNLIHDLLIRSGGAIMVASADFQDPALANPGHVVRGNIVYNISTRTQYSDGNGINVHRGAKVYNNVSYGNQHYGIRVDDKRGFGATVEVFHNTLFQNGSDDFGVFDNAVVDVKNNIGPTDPENIASAANLFVNAAQGDFHLVAGAAAIDAGQDVGIAIDLEGTPRPQGAGFDFGAYEYR